MKFEKHYETVCKKVDQRLKYLNGIKKFVSQNTMKVLVNAYAHSVINYAIEVWAIQSDEKLSKLQQKINRFLIRYFYPNLLRCRKKGRRNITLSINDILEKCNFLTVLERRNYVTLKLAMLDHLKSCDLKKLETDMELPRKDMPVFNSETFKGNLVYRTVKLWNAMPRNYIKTFTCGNEGIKTYIVKFRESVFINF